MAGDVSVMTGEGVAVSGVDGGGRDGAQARASRVVVMRIISIGNKPHFCERLDNISVVELYALMDRDVHSAAFKA